MVVVVVIANSGIEKVVGRGYTTVCLQLMPLVGAHGQSTAIQ